jgi:hypothetical protein
MRSAAMPLLSLLPQAGVVHKDNTKRRGDYKHFVFVGETWISKKFPPAAVARRLRIVENPLILNVIQARPQFVKNQIFPTYTPCGAC